MSVGRPPAYNTYDDLLSDFISEDLTNVGDGFVETPAMIRHLSEGSSPLSGLEDEFKPGQLVHAGVTGENVVENIQKPEGATRKRKVGAATRAPTAALENDHPNARARIGGYVDEDFFFDGRRCIIGSTGIAASTKGQNIVPVPSLVPTSGNEGIIPPIAKGLRAKSKSKTSPTKTPTKTVRISKPKVEDVAGGNTPPGASSIAVHTMASPAPPVPKVSNYTLNGKTVCAEGKFSDWVLLLNTKERNVLAKELEFTKAEKAELVLRARRHKHKLSQKTYSRKAGKKRDESDSL